MANSNSRSRRSGGLAAGFKTTKMIWVAIVIVALIIAYGSFRMYSAWTNQSTYYVLNHSVAARTQITGSDLATIQTSSDGVPPNAYTLADVQQGTIYSKYALSAGDVLSPSNSGSLDTINEGIPDNWVITSFQLDSNDAVTGYLQRGDYFDMMILGMNKGDKSTGPAADLDGSYDVSVGQYAFRNILLLDSPASAQNLNDGSDQAAGNAATTQQTNNNSYFVVGMSPQNAAMLQIVLNKYSVKMVVSPKQNTYANPNNLNELYKTFEFNKIINDHESGIIASNCVDSTTGKELNQDCTDPTFTKTQRDKFGVPYNAKDSEKDENGEPKPLTEFEQTWCTQLYSDEYYGNSKWDKEKKYCKDNGFKGEDRSKKAAEESNNATSKLGGSSDSNATGGDTGSTEPDVTQQ